MATGPGAPIGGGMRPSPSPHPAVAAVVLTFAAAISACQPTGHPRCDALKAQRAVAETLDFQIRCDADFPGVSGEGRSVLGWTDYKTRSIWLWTNKMGDDRVLRKVAWHELGHVVWDRKGLAGTQAAEERWADGYSYCTEPIAGVGYSSRPKDCRGYRL